MYRTVVTICTDSLTFTNSTFCPHSVFVCFVWTSEQTAINSLYNINWLVCITQTVCLLCGTDWVFIYNSCYSQYLNGYICTMKLVILNGVTLAHLTNPKATMHVNHKALTPLHTNKITLVLRRESALSDSLTRRQSCTFIW